MNKRMGWVLLTVRLLGFALVLWGYWHGNATTGMVGIAIMLLTVAYNE